MSAHAAPSVGALDNPDLDRYKTPSTIVCRWQSATAQSAIPLLARTITTSLQGQPTGRVQMQWRPMRMPPSLPNQQPSPVAPVPPGKELGRNMYVLRSSARPDSAIVFIQDPNAPTRRQRAATSADPAAATTANGTVAARASTTKHDRDDPALSHSRWTFAAFGSDPFASASEGASSGASANTGINPFDVLLQRVLLQQTGNAVAAANSHGPGWVARATAVSLDGFTFSIGSQGGTGDWEVKVFGVTTKGAAAGSLSKGIIVEVKYLGTPYLPPQSSFVRNFAASLFPPQALTGRDIEFVAPDHEGLFEAGITTMPDEANGEEPGEYEWTEAHSAWTSLQLLKREGLL
ncbi:hypothetical protein OIV83_000540 [Microbotryomycetes sp. JL201]|nr:hypothetical protein OIV83_000540 [Microbotryomycetes sp. JL201]